MSEYDLGTATGLDGDGIAEAITNAKPTGGLDTRISASESLVLLYSSDSFTESGYLSDSDGTITDESDNSLTTDFIEVTSDSHIIYTGDNDLDRALVCFYNSSYEFIEAYLRTDQLAKTGKAINEQITPPSDAAYFRASGKGVGYASYSELYIFTVSKNFAYLLKDSLSRVDSSWSGWNKYNLQFGITEGNLPVPFVNKSMGLNYGTVVCLGNTSAMRWGYHVFEGYAEDEKSRITMLVNKHEEEGKALAELYYYLDKYTHHENAYGYYKIGSDVAQHSFMYSRDKAISFGEHDYRNLITLANVDVSTDIDSTYDNIEDADDAYEPETDAEENAACVLYLAMLNAGNGAMFYDSARDEIVVKKGGVWHDVTTTVTGGTYP